ncbi:hypothetical protein HYW55_01175 [Candidatus Gottesmanbacteria bacterium]|nr:hypothetical protein [Candidatus Gottesmanbacteria bacterium]
MGGLHGFVSVHKKLLIILGIVLFILFGSIVALLIKKTASNEPLLPNSTQTFPSPTPIPLSDQKVSLVHSTIYYVKIQAGSSEDPPKYSLFTADSTGTTSTNVGEIAGPAKQILPILDGKYLFIGDLGFLERGNTIYLYDAKTDETKPFLSASSGFQIESYLLSPDKSAIIIWEQSVGATTDGISQIVHATLEQIEKKRVLLSENVGDQTKYPLFWSRATGKIYLDSYSVSKNGKSRGIFELSTNGNIRPVRGLAVDEYSASPILSPRGDTIAYTAFNAQTGVKIPSPNVPNGLLRESIRNPNQLKVYNLITEEMETLLDNTQGTLFDSLIFDKDGRNLIYRTLKITSASQTVPQEYRKINLATRNNELFAKNVNGIFLTQFANNDMLFGTRSQIIDSIGNLSSGSFGQILSGVYLYSPFSQTYSKILTDDPIQIFSIENQ